MEIFNLNKVKKMLEEKGHTVYYVAVYGSQNYNLHTEHSDLDYKAIILPTIDEIIANSKPFSSTYEFNGGLVDVKDIRSYIDSAVKCNVNFIEILNTPYFIWDAEIRKFFLPLQKELGQLFLKACYGMILEKNEALRHPYPSTISKIEKFWYDPKQLHHIVRLRILMKRFVEWDIGNFYHDLDERNELIHIKNGGISNEEATVMAEHNIYLAKRIRDEYTQELEFNAKNEMIEFWRKIIKENIVKNL